MGRVEVEDVEAGSGVDVEPGARSFEVAGSSALADVSEPAVGALVEGAESGLVVGWSCRIVAPTMAATLTTATPATASCLRSGQWAVA